MSQTNEARAVELLGRAERAAAARDRAGVKAALNLLGEPTDAAGLWARGRMLDLLAKEDDAERAFASAVAADPGFAPAHHSLAVLLARTGREEEAAAHWQAAVEADPAHTDALYNLGQFYYNQALYDLALETWSAARAVVPDDLDVRRKVVQALHALGRHDDADGALVELREVWNRLPDDARPDEVVIDQFNVADRRVVAVETLRPARDDLYYALTFRQLDDQGGVAMSVQLESSAYGRERGVPFLVGVNTARGHQVVGPMFKERPPYSIVRPMAEQLIERHSG